MLHFTMKTKAISGEEQCEKEDNFYANGQKLTFVSVTLLTLSFLLRAI